MLKSDIFFMVTTIAVVLITIGIAIALIYLIRILRDAHKVSEVIRHEGEEIIGDITTARTEIKNTGIDIFTVVKTLLGITRKKKKTQKK